MLSNEEISVQNKRHFQVQSKNGEDEFRKRKNNLVEGAVEKREDILSVRQSSYCGRSGEQVKRTGAPQFEIISLLPLLTLLPDLLPFSIGPWRLGIPSFPIPSSLHPFPFSSLLRCLLSAGLRPPLRPTTNLVMDVGLIVVRLSRCST